MSHLIYSSVSKICDRGNRVVFKRQGGFIESQSGARTSFRAKELGEQVSGFCLAEQVRLSEGGCFCGRARNTRSILQRQMGWRGSWTSRRARTSCRRMRNKLKRSILYVHISVDNPTPSEVRLHKLTHLPFWKWCPEFVAGAANDHPHRTRPGEVREPLVVPQVHWDCCSVAVPCRELTWSGSRNKLFEIFFALKYMVT